MSKQEFIDDHIVTVLQDARIKGYFERAKSDEEKKALRAGLEQSLGTAYDAKAKEYFDSKGMMSKVASVLRGAGFVANAIGTYAFWALGGAGLVSKTAGLAATGLAELIDNAHYESHRQADGLEKYISKDGLKIATESVAQLAAGYIPLGGEVWSVLRGQSKYDGKIVDQALAQGKDEFVKAFGKYEEKEFVLEPVGAFANEHYAEPRGIIPHEQYQRPYVREVPVEGAFQKRGDVNVVDIASFRNKEYVNRAA